MRLSVLSTLREALRLWLRHPGFFVLLALFLACPELVVSFFQRRHLDLDLWNALTGIAGVIIGIFFQAAGMAAALTFLIEASPQINWRAISTGVCRYTGQLLGVQVLLIGLGILLMIPLGMVALLFHAAFGMSLFFMILAELIFLVFLKYALADPLVVAENHRAPDALAISWQMTRNQFGFVFGCYLIAGVLEWAIDAGLNRLDFFVPGIWPVTTLVAEFIGTYWYVLPWVMYLQIKAVTSEPPPPVHPA